MQKFIKVTRACYSTDTNTQKSLFASTKRLTQSLLLTLKAIFTCRTPSKQQQNQPQKARNAIRLQH